MCFAVVDEILETIWGHTYRKDLIINAYNATCQKPEFVKFKKINDRHFVISWKKWELQVNGYKNLSASLIVQF